MFARSLTVGATPTTARARATTSATRGRTVAAVPTMMASRGATSSVALGGARTAYGGAKSGALRARARAMPTLGGRRRSGLVVEAMFEVRATTMHDENARDEFTCDLTRVFPERRLRRDGWLTSTNG